MVADYLANTMTLGELARKYCVGTSTIFRWLQSENVLISHSERKAIFSARQPVGRDKIGIKGVFHTAKGERWIPTDSNYEYARLEQLESDASVIDVARCDHLIRYVYEGRERTYIPDFLVQYADGRTYVEEVKPQYLLGDGLVLAKAEAAVKFLAPLGIEYRFIHEGHIGQCLLEAVVSSCEALGSPEYQAYRAARRREQLRLIAKRYYANKKAKLKAAP